MAQKAVRSADIRPNMIHSNRSSRGSAHCPKGVSFFVQRILAGSGLTHFEYRCGTAAIAAFTAARSLRRRSALAVGTRPLSALFVTHYLVPFSGRIFDLAPPASLSALLK